MPMHDWTRVSAGTFHDFHNAWITHIKESLNAGLLPPEYYALGEQRMGEYGPDVLTLRADHVSEPELASSFRTDEAGMVAVAALPPRVQTFQEASEDIQHYLKHQRAIIIRHSSDDHVVAMIEIVSRANRNSLRTLTEFADKVVDSIRHGIHVVVIDPFPSGQNDPNGIHGFIWRMIDSREYPGDRDRPLTLVSYEADRMIKAWVQPLAVGELLTEMPLFLTPGHYVPLPLETTYMQSWAGVPDRWKRVVVGE